MQKIKLGDRAFGLTLSGLLAFLAFLGWFLFDAISVWLIVLALLFAAAALILPSLLWPFNLVWSRLILPVMARLNNQVLLGAIFYLFITPAALIMRIFRRDPMERALHQSVPSYFKPPLREVTSENFRDQF
jgi:hypothetical protein